MSERKPRLLLVGEFSALASGYATYAMEVQKRLHATGKYEMAELACYGSPEDPRRYELPWTYFPNMPAHGMGDERARYDSRESNQFGEWSFNDVALRFRPDVVWDFRDPWMYTFEQTSPHRNHYRHVVMAPVDAIPQQEQWLDTFMSADAVLTYTDWGRGVLRREGGGLINLRGTAAPGADLGTFRPMHRADVRRRFGFSGDEFIVGMIGRNQFRKLFPQLIADFATFLRACDPDLARRSYLYLHTSHPDNGWDIPRLIKQSGISHKILLTYRCRACSVIFPSLFQDARGVCVKCGKPTATMPNVEHSVGRESLAAIMNLFDVYVQYASSEGLGMPQVEAAACGVPVMAVDYSGMSDVVRKVDGYPIAVSHFDVDAGSDRLMARPDGGDLVRRLLHFAGLGEGERAEKSFRARGGAERHYTWDGAAAAWMAVFDSLPLRPAAETWESPPRIHRPGLMPSVFPSHEAFVRWGIENVVGRPEIAGGYAALRMIRDLNWGWTHQAAVSYLSEESYLGQRKKSRPFGVAEATAELMGMCEYYNEWEEKRCRTLDSSNRC